jgi:hypothetical protein
MKPLRVLWSGMKVFFALLIPCLFLVASGQPACADDAAQILKQVKDLRIKDPNFKIDLKLRGGKAKLQTGEIVSFALKSDRDCYVTLIHVDRSGKPSILFPNEWTKSSFVKGGQEYLIPPPDSDFHITAKEPVGVEYVKAIASTEPITSISHSDLEQTGSFAVVRNPGLVMKGLAVEMGKKDQREWSTADVVFTIAPAKQ